MHRRQLLGFLFVFLFIAPGWSVFLAQAQGGTVTNFSSGSAEETVTVTSGQHGPIALELLRNTTVTSASFFIKPDSSGTSAGSVSLDVNQDGLPEWDFNQTGYGDLGQQNEFTNGASTGSVSIQPASVNQSTPSSPSFYMPSGATVSSASVGVEFSPSLAGGFFNTGYIHHLAVGDPSGDGLDDVVLFSQTANMSSGANGSSNATVGPAFRVLAYNASTGVSLSAWEPSCNNVTETFSADLDGDGYEDVINHAASDRKLCIHFVNSTTGGFEPQLNVSLSSAIRDLAFIDFTGVGADQMVTVQTSGKVAYADFDTRSNAFTERGSETVLIQGTQTPANLNRLLVDYFNGSGNLPILIAVDVSNEGTEVFSTSNGLAVGTTTISGISSDAIVSDLDGDGDLDILASRSTGHRSITKDFNGWSGDNHNSIISLTNASVLNHDLVGGVSLLQPNMGNPDGNPATVDGNLTVRNISSGGFGNQAYTNRVSQFTASVLEPWTQPRAISLGDLDGDGIMEHIVLVGEGNLHGVFVSAYHRVGYDVDQNGQADVESEGYAGNGSNGLQPLAIIDMTGTWKDSLDTFLPGLTYTGDAYGIEMAEVNMSMQAIAAGTFGFSSLDVVYLADFLVNSNPHVTSNLSNALNQRMTAGTGSLTVPFAFTTSQDGSFVLHSPTVVYQPGAPNIALPPTPVLRLSDLEPDRVLIEWQNITDFGDDLLNFVVYREVTGQSPDTTQPGYTSSVANNTIDFAVQPGDAWTYWVRSVHDFGVTSNLSLPLDVVVPYPLPKSYVPDVTADDALDDTGGVLNVTWGQGDASIAEHRVYVSSSNFTSIEGMNSSATADDSTFALQINQDGSGQALADGLPYYVAVVGFDRYGNASSNVTALGPVFTRNNTALETGVEVAFTSFAEEASVDRLLLARSESLSMSAFLHHDGQGLANQTLVLHIVGASQQLNVSVETNATGHASLEVATLSDLGPLSAIGEMELKVAFAGYDQDPSQQPLAASSNTTPAYGTVPLGITGPSTIELDDDDGFSTVLSVTTPDITQETALANVQAYWEALTDDGRTASSGTAEVRGNEMAISGLGAHDGTLTLYLDSESPDYHVEGMQVSFAFEAAPVVEGNSTNTTNETNTSEEPTFPDITLPALVDCGTATYGWEENATDVTITCSVRNPNPFTVVVGFNWNILPTTPPSIDVTYDGTNPAVKVEANGTTDLIFSLVRNGPTESMYPGEQGKTYTITLTCDTASNNACTGMTQDAASYEGELVWTLGEMPVVDDPTTNTQQDDTSSAMTPVVVGLGVLIAVLAVVGGVLYMRNNREDLFEEEDEEDYYGMVENDEPLESAEVQANVDLASSKSLDELKKEGKELHEAAPEGLASSPTLGSSADAFEFGATAEDALDSNDEHHDDGAEDESDDGITVDENGTEWYEDEVGVWWYREEGWDDWVAWED